MIKKILIALGVLVLALVGLIMSRPDTYRVERSVTVKAKPELAYAYLLDFNQFEQWSPWAHLDPGMKKEIQGEGQGATYYWSGNDDVGEGRMTIKRVKAPSEIDLELEFLRPFASKAETGYLIAPEGEGAKVTWWMTGQNNFMSKAFGLFVNMEDMIGKDYEKGLAALQPRLEAKATEEAAKAALAAPPAADAPAPDGAEPPPAGEATP